MNLEKVLGKQFAPIEQTVSEHDCILYALGLGLGTEPTNPAHLQFAYEKNLKVFPSQAVVIADAGNWDADPELEIDWVKLLHGEQSLIQHQHMQAGRTYIAQNRVLGVIDKGVDKGSIIYFEKTLTDKQSGELTSTMTASLFARGDGGCGSSDYRPATSIDLPERAEDKTVQIVVPQNAALIYRLSGDLNPIHSDPDIARKAGFDRPILHGLCTFGLAIRALLDTYCDADPTKLESINVRFSAPVYPGETVYVRFWRENNGINFDTLVKERNTKVLDRGLAQIR